MNHRIVDIVALCAVAGACGCSSVARDRASVEPDGPQAKPVPATSKSSSDPDPVIDDVLIVGTVSGTFPAATPDQCKPLGVPITMFVSDVFGGDALIDELATPSADSKCSHEQTLAATASTWATLAYDVVCRGGGDPQICGATTTRRCSLDLLVQWAEDRSLTVSTPEPTFGFVIDVPPQQRAARIALYRRAQQEARSLFDEANVALSSGSRHCPDENTELIAKMYADALEIERWLGMLIANETPDGR